MVPRDQLQSAARELAEKLLTKAPLCARPWPKAVMNTCDSIDFGVPGRILERIGQSVLIRTEDHKEGVRAFREKRPPNYQGQ